MLVRKGDLSMTQIKKVSCYFCHMNCGMLAYVEDDKVVKVVGDPEHPSNAGAQCSRGFRP